MYYVLQNFFTGKTDEIISLFFFLQPEHEDRYTVRVLSGGVWCRIETGNFDEGFKGEGRKKTNEKLYKANIMSIMSNVKRRSTDDDAYIHAHKKISRVDTYKKDHNSKFSCQLKYNQSTHAHSHEMREKKNDFSSTRRV